MPQPDRTPDTERPLKPDVPETPGRPFRGNTYSTVRRPASAAPEGRRAGRLRRFVARQLRRGADNITARRAARTGR